MHFGPDFGTAIVKMGSHPGFQWLFPFAKFPQFVCVHDDLYTMAVTIPVGGVEHLASFDADGAMFNQILEFTDSENREHILKLIEPGQMVTALRPVFVSLDTIVGEPTRGQHDIFIPLIIKGAKKLDEADFRAVAALLSADDAT